MTGTLSYERQCIMKNWFKSALFSLASGAVVGLGLLASTCSLAADGDPFPNKPIRVIVPFGPGSGTDLTTRYMAQAITESAGWKFVVDNKPGANGFIAVQELLRAAPDGYTMLMSGNTTHAANPVLFKKLPYDPIEDFIPLARLNVAPLVLFVAPKHQIDTVGQLIDLIRKNPGKLAYATGSASHRAAAEIFKLGKQLDIVHAPYKSSPQAIADLLGGHVDFMFVDLGAGMSFIRNNQLKAVALTSIKRVDVLPSVPTMHESGFAGMEVTGWTGLFLPKKTPQPVVDALSKAAMQYAGSDAARKFASDNGSLIEVMTPAQSMAWVRSEINRYGQIYKQAGIEPE
jgi:tripartite-type tricarboxylate transporter receptor subunit TctC